MNDKDFKKLVEFLEEHFDADFSGYDLPKWKYLKGLWEDWERARE